MLGREEFGEIQFLGAVNVRDLALDMLIEIDKGRIQLYGLGSGPPAPPPGSGLNAPAILTFRRGPSSQGRWHQATLGILRKLSTRACSANRDRAVWGACCLRQSLCAIGGIPAGSHALF